MKNLRSRILKSLMVVMLVGFAPMAAQAGLIGADVNVTWYFPDDMTLFCDNGNQTVSAALEYPAGCGGFGPVSIDVQDSALVVSEPNIGFANTAFNGFLISVLTGPAITSATLDPTSTHGVASLNVTPQGLWVNFSGTSGQTAIINLTTADAPEPSTLALLGLGLAFARRKRQI